MPSMTTCLWFTGQANEAVNFYLSIFADGKVLETSRYTDEPAKHNGFKAGDLLAIWFEIMGQRFIAMNAKPMFQFTEAVSFVIECATQDEIDYYWDRLTAGGGQEIQCGWLKDKFGVTWQVCPASMAKMVSDPDPAKVARVMKAFGPMKKLDLAKIEKAFRGR